MPQDIRGEGFIPLKEGARPKIEALAEPLQGWLEWDRFEFTDGGLAYAYDDVVTVGTAGELDAFLEQIAAEHALIGWAHFGPDDEVTYYGADEAARFKAEIDDLQRLSAATAVDLAQTRAKLDRLA